MATYVANENDYALSVIAAEFRAILARVVVAREPDMVVLSPDGALAAVTHETSSDASSSTRRPRWRACPCSY